MARLPVIGSVEELEMVFDCAEENVEIRAEVDDFLLYLSGLDER
jgi:hypothetical protein